MSETTIRDAVPGDETTWRNLWQDYCAFYEAVIPETVTATTWKRMLDSETPEFGCLVAMQDDVIVGFANYVLHPHTWFTGMQCYLNDLFVVPAVRGGGIGRQLIDALRIRGGERGWDRIHLLTDESNSTARRLYDHYSAATGLIQYVIPVESKS